MFQAIKKLPYLTSRLQWPQNPASGFQVVRVPRNRDGRLWGLLQIISWERMAPPQDIVEIGVRGSANE